MRSDPRPAGPQPSSRVPMERGPLTGNRSADFIRACDDRNATSQGGITDCTQPVASTITKPLANGGACIPGTSSLLQAEIRLPLRHRSYFQVTCRATMGKRSGACPKKTRLHPAIEGREQCRGSIHLIYAPLPTGGTAAVQTTESETGLCKLRGRPGCERPVGTRLEEKGEPCLTTIRRIPAYPHIGFRLWQGDIHHEHFASHGAAGRLRGQSGGGRRSVLKEARSVPYDRSRGRSAKANAR